MHGVSTLLSGVPILRTGSSTLVIVATLFSCVCALLSIVPIVFPDVSLLVAVTIDVSVGPLISQRDMHRISTCGFQVY